LYASILAFPLLQFCFCCSGNSDSTSKRVEQINHKWQFHLSLDEDGTDNSSLFKESSTSPTAYRIPSLPPLFSIPKQPPLPATWTRALVISGAAVRRAAVLLVSSEGRSERGVFALSCGAVWLWVKSAALSAPPSHSGIKSLNSLRWPLIWFVVSGHELAQRDLPFGLASGLWVVARCLSWCVSHV